MKTRPVPAPSLPLKLIIPALLLGLLLGAPLAHGANAVFSKEGDRIFFAAGRLKTLDLNHPDHIEALTSATLWGEKVEAVDRANDGAILCLTPHHLGSFDPRRRAFTPLHDASPSQRPFIDLAVNPADGLVLISSVSRGGEEGDEPFILLQPGSPVPMRLFSRRVFAMEGPVFDREGRLYFSYQGDLWRGSVCMEKLDDEETSAPGNMRGVLEAVRIAPLGRLETYVGTPAGTRVMEIAPAGPLIYIHTQRMYGTGWGSLFTVATPPDAVKREDGEYGDFIAILSSVKMIDSAGSATCLCISPDGRRVFYRANRSYWLIENGGKPKELPLHEELWDF